MFIGGKTADLMNCFNPRAKTVVFDMARCNNPEWFPWNFMENLKNGWFTATKYQGGTKVMEDNLKIIVFMNENPPRNKLSKDRYDVFILN